MYKHIWHSAIVHGLSTGKRVAFYYYIFKLREQTEVEHTGRKGSMGGSIKLGRD